ncbi:hypothetical protein ACL1FG_01105 [Corynebacterium striatum]
MNIQGFGLTNKGRAALIAMQENNKQDEEVPAHYRIADALAEAGLLAPDLPEPKEIDRRVYRWSNTHVRAAYDIRSGAAEEVDAPGGVTVYADPESDLEIWVDVDHGEQLLTPKEARALALAVLAAADYAEEEA